MMHYDDRESGIATIIIAILLGVVVVILAHLVV